MAAMELQGARRFALTSRLMPNSETWVEFSPRITVEPHEHLLLRFEFDPALSYRGYLILQSEHGYREYHLPDSGQGRAFGVGKDRPSVVSLWNSGDSAEQYKITLAGEPGNTMPRAGGGAGNLVVSRFDGARLPIHVTSLIPYRAEIASKDGGTLETFRVSIPGYRATVDGRDVPVGVSAEQLVTVPVPAGAHSVELRFAGTALLWGSAALSGLGWAALLVILVAGSPLRKRLFGA